LLVENGVDLRLWHAGETPTPRTGRSGALRLVFMGRLVDWKAVDLLLQAFAQARQQVPVTLLIIGDGPERESLQAQARQSEMLSEMPWQEGRVHFAGWQPQRACAQWLHDSDVLLLTSLLECGGAVVLEAMSMGLPVIASDWGGPADYLDPSCGILIAPEGAEQFPQAIASAIEALASDPARRAAMGLQGVEKVRREFDWEVKVDRVVGIYEAVISQGRLSS
jgi:glycosyltransferase involved in cell wall biosynthesis